MSLQRIIELARRQGMPVILTDVAGREPMVVLPLEAYEKMLDVPRVGQEEGGGRREGGGGRGEEHKPNNASEQKQKQRGNRFQEEGESQEASGSLEVNPPASRLPPPSSQPDGLRVRQRDEDRVQALHRSLDTVSHEVPAQQLPQKEGGDDLVLEERFSFQP